MRKRFVLMFMSLLMVLCSVQAEDTPNSRQARRIFNSAYQKVFGEQGATLYYDVNIIGIYKTNGTIWYKGKKSKFEDAKMNSWNDGVTVYTIKKKKPENFDYSISEQSEGLMLTLKAKKGKKGIKEVHALVKRLSYEPISVRIKIAFIWTTIRISNFRSGGITDEMLRFPMEKYKDYEFVDKR